MSLWYESLAMGIYDCGGNKQARARCILSHFSMPVPRSWWEDALKTGRVDETHASVLRESLAALSSAVGPGEDLNCGLLVALAFVEEPFNESGSNIPSSITTVEDYLIEARKVLAERPDLARLGRLIDGKARAA
ncbi:MAG TPA: hypothetical protein VK852_05300 [Desulfobacterales bacterium]|jgi:hypothetical protein|nr:hypothetical protein [Desulfobacterales bacterium]